ncbi:cold-shock protein [Rickettsiales endosymbiont of Peranema trichophorum]|uniref:cold-shock protein n=1 Tax=Rickettsiales endosymbiont of Peranema trichophorum TaxID=2486577 RepID=UPI001022F8BD|nr:cold-shock protein [Rickettsiales endosymbiont of Peranema trichophorum]RZI47225.1 cold-shock protein [Rickettsiales endosymbiont of Peranema trichophorum]
MKHKGTIKWFNATKGYGFIKPDDSGSDVFVHISSLKSINVASMVEGQKVGYELVQSPNKKVSAENVVLI